MTGTPKHLNNPVEKIEIAADQAGQRIDNFLLTHLKGVPRSLIYRILRRGEVRVNKGRIKPHYRIQSGDQVRIPPIDRESPIPAQAPNKAIESIRSSILYEDERVLILNKPSGMAVHGGSGLSFGVIEALRSWRPEAPFLELVHRLDRDTSGCLVIAKSRNALRQLHTLLREEDSAGMEKRYLALVKGKWQGGTQDVNVPLQKNLLSSGERLVKVNRAGKASLTRFRPLAITPLASLVEAQLFTGRTHQVRVHATHINYPIAGDPKYGDEEFNRIMREHGLKRLFLHAWRLEFTLEDPRQTISVTAPLDLSLQQVLQRLDMAFDQARLSHA